MKYKLLCEGIQEMKIPQNRFIPFLVRFLMHFFLPLFHYHSNMAVEHGNFCVFCNVSFFRFVFFVSFRLILEKYRLFSEYDDLSIGYQFANIWYHDNDTHTLGVDVDLINDVHEQIGGGGEQLG